MFLTCFLIFPMKETSSLSLLGGKNENDNDDDDDDYHDDDEFSLALYETSIRSSDVIKIMKNNSWIITKIQYLERKSPLPQVFCQKDMSVPRYLSYPPTEWRHRVHEV